MNIDWKFIDSFLIGESETDDLSADAKKEIGDFLQIHDFSVFSDETLEQLAGIWDLAYKDEYIAVTGTKIPNIFRNIRVEEAENER